MWLRELGRCGLSRMWLVLDNILCDSCCSADLARGGLSVSVLLQLGCSVCCELILIQLFALTTLLLFLLSLITALTVLFFLNVVFDCALFMVAVTSEFNYNRVIMYVMGLGFHSSKFRKNKLKIIKIVCRICNEPIPQTLSFHAQ